MRTPLCMLWKMKRLHWPVRCVNLAHYAWTWACCLCSSSRLLQVAQTPSKHGGEGAVGRISGSWWPPSSPSSPSSQMPPTAALKTLLGVLISTEGIATELHAWMLHALTNRIIPSSYACLTFVHQVGCVACVLGDPTCGAATVVGAAEAAAYLTLLPAAPWPSSSTSSSSSDGVTPAQAAVLRARTMGAVMGSLVADAAAAGCHWIYDLDLMTTLAQEATNRHLTHSQVTRPTGTSNSTDHHTNSSTSGSCRIADAAAAVSRALYAPPLEFQDPPRSPYYTYAVGRNSPYGEQALVLLRSVAGAGGLDCIDYAHKFGAYFGAGFDGYRDVSTKGEGTAGLLLGLLHGDPQTTAEHVVNRCHCV